MLFSYNKNVNFPDTSVGKNRINETSVTKFLGIHLDKKLNFVNDITEMSMKVAKSIGLLYKLNCFLPETILKTLNTLLIHPYLSYHTYHIILTIPYLFFQHRIYTDAFQGTTIVCQINKNGFTAYKFVTLNNMITNLGPSDESGHDGFSSQDSPPCCCWLSSGRHDWLRQRMVQGRGM